MVRINKRGLSEDLQEKISADFLKEIKNLKNSQELNNFLSRFLTPDEQIMIKKRLAIPLLFQEGKRKKQISEILDVSRNTINFVLRIYRKYN